MQVSQQLIVIFGPSAVGKMTVGKRLEEKLGYKLFHNHLSIELVRNFFDFDDTPFWPLVSKIRRTIFEEVAASYLPGFVFTYVWDLDAESDRSYIKEIVDLFQEKMWEVKFVELEAKLGIRLERNRGEDRLKAKPSKQDLEESDAYLMEEQAYRVNTTEEMQEVLFDNQAYVKINSTNLSAAETADMIIDHFDLRNLPENKFK